MGTSTLRAPSARAGRGLGAFALGSLLLLGCASSMPRLGAPLVPATGEVPRERFAGGNGGFCAIRTPGEVLCWRAGGTDDRMARVGAFRDAVEVGVGAAHACALRATGEVLCWGANDDGQLGQPLERCVRSAAPLAVPALGFVERLAVSEDSTCVLERGGRVLCFGYNAAGLVPGAPQRVAQPTPIVGLDRALQLSLDSGIGCVTHADGGVSCWGGGDPERVFLGRVAGVSDAVEVRASGMLGCARLRSGRLRCWRHPSPMQGFGLGMGSPTDDDPVRHPDVDDAVGLYVHWATVCARRQNGELRCSGRDGQGPVEEHTLDSFETADAVAFVSLGFGCGLDAEGRILTQPRAVGFCGEASLVADGSGADLVEARKAGFSAETTARLRLGYARRMQPEELTEGLFTFGLESPWLFGLPDGVRLGPVLDLASSDFEAFEPTGGVMLVVPVGPLALWADGAAGYALREAGSEPVIGGVVGAGYQRRFDAQDCSGDCGLGYAMSGGLEFTWRRGLLDPGILELGIALTIDPALLFAPFALAFADWGF